MTLRRTSAATLLVMLTAGSQSPAVGPLRFYSISPCRVVDTRNISAPRLFDESRRHFQIRGLCGIPSSGPLAVVVNAAVVQPGAAGHLTLWPYDPNPGSPVPNVATLNYPAGEFAIANGAIVPLHATDTSFQLSAIVDMYPSGYADLVLDAVGYFQ